MATDIRESTNQDIAAKLHDACLLSINGGSSSIKFGVYKSDVATDRVLSGKIERIGLPEAIHTFQTDSAAIRTSEKISAPNYAAAVTFLIDWLESRVGFNAVKAIGHRVVHGGPKYRQPHFVTDELLEELHRLSSFNPEHIPAQIQLIEAFRKRYPNIPQVACFDTAFHSDMPRVARLLPIPRRFDAMGIQRYGFHGLSYAFLMEELGRVGGAAAAEGRVILAHLGNGASLAAVRGGKCIDTSMAFTPTAGLPMSTRSGDLDPGLVWYLARTAQMTPEQFHTMVNRESGLLGVSETSSDMRDLLEREAGDIRAAEAVALFCYQTKKWIGGFAAALGGLDTLVFSGGIGENAWQVRGRICDGLEFLGIEMDAALNQTSAPVISKTASRTSVRVIKTDEESMIAKAVTQILEHETEQ